MTTEEKLKYARFQMNWHAKEAEEQLLKADAFRLKAEELERTLATEAIMAETSATVNAAAEIKRGLQ